MFCVRQLVSNCYSHLEISNQLFDAVEGAAAGVGFELHAEVDAAFPDVEHHAVIPRQRRGEHREGAVARRQKPVALVERPIGLHQLRRRRRRRAARLENLLTAGTTARRQNRLM